MIAFPATDIEYALQAEIDSLKEQEKYLRQSLKEEEALATERAKTCLHWAKRAIEAEREIERLRVIEAAHHRVIDALWGGKYWAAVGKEWGRNQSETSYPTENYTQYAI
jgi:hypothetical protein